MDKEAKIHDDEYYYKIIRENIRHFRLKNNLTQQQLADMIDMSREYICDIEDESRNKHLTIAVLGRIADAMNIDIANFFNKPLKKLVNPKTLKFGDSVIITRTNCDDIQGFIISAKGIEPIEDKDIPLIPDDELHEFNTKEKILNLDKLNYNFKVLKEKINQIATEFNEYRKENE